MPHTDLDQGGFIYNTVPLTKGPTIGPIPTELAAVATTTSTINTRAVAISTIIPGTITGIQTYGYTSVGDGGGALYKKVVSSSGPTGFQSADGAFWSLADPIINVLACGAKGDGSTNDTTAFQNACNFAGENSGKLVYAPGGFSYVLNGLALVGGTHDGLNLTIDGTVLVPPGNGAVTTSGITCDNILLNCRIKIKILRGQEGQTRPHTNNHLCAGITIFNGGGNIFEVFTVQQLTAGFQIRIDLASDTSANCAENHFIAKNNDQCFYGLRSEGGVGGNTEGTRVDGDLWSTYAYGIYKSNTGGSQHFWTVNCGFDGFSNADLVADVFDDYGDTAGQNSSVYQTDFASVGKGFQGNAFTNIESAALVNDISRITGKGSGASEVMLLGVAAGNAFGSTIEIDLSNYTNCRGIRLGCWYILPTNNGASLTAQVSRDGVSYDTAATYRYAGSVINSSGGSSPIFNTQTSFPVLSSLNNTSSSELEIIIPTRDATILQPYRWSGTAYINDGSVSHIDASGIGLAGTGVTKKIRFQISSGNVTIKYAIYGLRW